MRSRFLYRFTIYGLAIALCVLLQMYVLVHLSIGNTFPFIYPMVVSTIAALEGTVRGTKIAIAFGVLIDILIPAPIPCFFTLLFLVIAFFSGLIGESVIPQGLLCSFVTALLAYSLSILLYSVTLSPSATFSLVLVQGLKEAGLSLLFLPLCHRLFFKVYQESVLL